jgi:hypothetical protein
VRRSPEATLAPAARMAADCFLACDAAVVELRRSFSSPEATRGRAVDV